MSSFKAIDDMVLHDSIILRAPEVRKGQVIFSVELCNFKQSSYQDTEPEMSTGILAFSGTSELATDPTNFLQTWPDAATVRF